MAEVAGRCVFCESEIFAEVFPVTDMFGVTRNLCVCRQCKTWFYDPPPTDQEISRAYGEAYYGKSDAKFRWGIVEKVVDTFRKQRALSIKRLTAGKGKVLDIGCGNGRLLHFLSGMGDYQLFGTEMPGKQAERAKQYAEIQLFLGPFENTCYPAQSFDAITLFHVFEHLQKPRVALEKIFQYLKPGGVLVMSFPNIRSLQARWLRAGWLHLDPPRHLFFPDHRMLTTYMENMGFSLMRKKYFSPEQNPAGAVQGLLNRMSGKRDLLFERMKGNVDYLPETGKGRLFLHKLFFIMAMPVFMIGDILESLAGSGATVELTFKKQNNEEYV